MSSPSLSGLAQKVSRVDIGLANTDTAAKAAAFRNMGITIGYELIGLG
jgi:5-enolpyruvylshikimate-3-phosphate synthase